MCGIWLYIRPDSGLLSVEVMKAFQLVSIRGPECTILLPREEGRVNVGFHRLKIVDRSDAGNAPFVTTIGDTTYVTICNGELYNWQHLADKYGITPSLTSSCDTEILPHLVHKFGIEKTCSLLDGVFAFCIINEKTKTLMAGRDTFGVRPMFYAKHEQEVAVSSVLKGIPPHLQKYAAQFPPSHCLEMSYSEIPINSSHSLVRWNPMLEKAFQVENLAVSKEGIDAHAQVIRELLIDAVRKRLMSDRPVCCLLSGGLDSSLITSLVCHLLPPDSPKVKTFAIGMPGSTDLKYARMTADFLGTDHHEILASKEDFLREIPNIVWETESYDTTTIRASTGNYLVSKYIRENTDCKVVFNGDGSDEVFMSYLYAKNAPTPEDFHKEAVRLLDNIHYFDVLRSDRSISPHGLESRTPFLDKEFVKYVLLHVPISDRCHPTVEKYILRYAFDDKEHPFLPQEVLWRKKEAFSDGVSSTADSWHSCIQKYVTDLGISSKLKHFIDSSRFDGPTAEESAWYFSMFQDRFPECEKVIPYYWMPKWCGDVQDPSARVLHVYKNETKSK